MRAKRGILRRIAKWVRKVPAAYEKQKRGRMLDPVIDAGGGLAPKLRGLGLLRKAVSRSGGAAKVLPYVAIRKPESFSLEKFGRLPSRVLVRADLAGKAVSLQAWGDLPRRVFDVDRRNAKNTEKEIRDFMKSALMHSSPSELATKGMFFIVHPLRPERDYWITGRVQAILSYETKGSRRVEVQFGDPDVDTFRGEYRNYYKRGRKLEGNVRALAEEIMKTLPGQFEASFVAYRDSRDTPEFYDLLMSLEHLNSARQQQI